MSNPEVIHFLLFLLDRGRIGELSEIVRIYREIWAKKKDLVQAELVWQFTREDAQKKLHDAVEKKFNRRANASYRQSPAHFWRYIENRTSDNGQQCQRGIGKIQNRIF